MATPKRYSARSWLWLFLTIALGIPAVVLRLVEVVAGYDLSPEMSTLVFGLGIVAASFLITWASEVAQLDLPEALALAFVALVAVLPEYAVDMVFAWKAGAHPLGECVNGVWVNGECVGGEIYNYHAYTAANMTGANRLVVGIGWPLVVLLFWFRERRTLTLERAISLEVVFLAAVTVYSFWIFYRQEIALWDAAILIGLFVGYLWMSGKARRGKPELIGPSAALGALRKRPRRTITTLLYLYSAAIILASAEPFAHGLVEVGKGLNIDEFVLVQWIAPLASESPEFIIAAIFTLRGNAVAGMVAMVSTRLNQWSLLVGCIPVVYSISLGEASIFHLDERQTEEFLLTAAQSVFAVSLLIRMSIGWLGALLLFALFTSQLFIPSVQARYYFSFGYLGVTLALFALDRQRLPILWHMTRGVAAQVVGRGGS